MATAAPERSREEAKVDRLVDENGYEIDVPKDSALKAATEIEQTVGATGPTNWWRLGLVALAILIAVLLAWQLAGGNAGTNMIPGTPTSAPATQPAV